MKSWSGVRGSVGGDRVTERAVGESRMNGSGVLGGDDGISSPSSVKVGSGGEKGHLVESDDAVDTGSFQGQEG